MHALPMLCSCCTSHLSQCIYACTLLCVIALTWGCLGLYSPHGMHPHRLPLPPAPPPSLHCLQQPPRAAHCRVPTQHSTGSSVRSQRMHHHNAQRAYTNRASPSFVYSRTLAAANAWCELQQALYVCKVVCTPGCVVAHVDPAPPSPHTQTQTALARPRSVGIQPSDIISCLCTQAVWLQHCIPQPTGEVQLESTPAARSALVEGTRPELAVHLSGDVSACGQA